MEPGLQLRVTHDDPKLLILLTWSPQYWDHRPLWPTNSVFEGTSFNHVEKAGTAAQSMVVGHAAEAVHRAAGQEAEWHQTSAWLCPSEA